MLSVVVIAKNERDRIRTCLESVKWADEIIVVDNGSVDDTVEIAKKYTDKIFKDEAHDFSGLRNRAMEKASGDWVLYVDADERVLLPLKAEIEQLTKTTDKSAFAISRINIIFGHEVSYGPYKHDWMIRLFKKSDFETWIGRVHEYGKFKGEMGYSKNSLLHLTHRNVDHFVKKSLEWSDIDAQLRLKSGHPQMTKWRFARVFVTELYQQGVKRRGFFAGTVGIIDSILQVFSLYLSYVKLWQLQQPRPLDEVYDDLDRKLLENNFNYK